MQPSTSSTQASHEYPARLPSRRPSASAGPAQDFRDGQVCVGNPLASTGSSSSDIQYAEPFLAGTNPMMCQPPASADPTRPQSYPPQIYHQAMYPHQQVPRPRQQITTLPSVPTFSDPMHLGSGDASASAPVLYANQTELGLLEPLGGMQSSYPQLNINLTFGMARVPEDQCFPSEAASHDLASLQHRRVVSSPPSATWENQPHVGYNPRNPFLGARPSTLNGMTMAPPPVPSTRPQLTLPMERVSPPAVATGAAGPSGINTNSPPTSGTTISTVVTASGSQAGGAGPVSSAVTGSPSASGGGTPQPLVCDPTAILPVSGNTATAVNKMLSELPPELQPVVLAKVAVKGRGGRQPAADPRDLDPNMDPRKVRRILANRQSAAKSKLKTRVLLETLKAGKEALAEQQGCVQQELSRLTQLVQTLEAQNRDLMQRLAIAEQHSSPASTSGHVFSNEVALPPPDADVMMPAVSMPDRMPSSMPGLPSSIPHRVSTGNVWLSPSAPLTAPQLLDLPQLSADDVDATEDTDMLTDAVKGWFTDDLAPTS